jgi:hypothetical protein
MIIERPQITSRHWHHHKVTYKVLLSTYNCRHRDVHCRLASADPRLAEHHYWTWKNDKTYVKKYLTHGSEYPSQWSDRFCSSSLLGTQREACLMCLKLSLCLTKYRAMKNCGSGGIARRILNFGTRWRWVVSFTPRPLYPQRKSPPYPLDRRLGGPQSRSGRGDEKNSQPPPRESNPRTPIVQPVAQRSTDWAITALHTGVTLSSPPWFWDHLMTIYQLQNIFTGVWGYLLCKWKMYLKKRCLNVQNILESLVTGTQKNVCRS